MIACECEKKQNKTKNKNGRTACGLSNKEPILGSWKHLVVLCKVAILSSIGKYKKRLLISCCIRVLCTCVILEGSVLVVRSFDIVNFSLEIVSLEIPSRFLKIFRKETVRVRERPSGYSTRSLKFIRLLRVVWVITTWNLGYSTRGFTRPDLLDEKAWFHGRKMADCSVLRVVEFYSGVGGMHFALNGKGDSAINLTRNPGELHIDHLHVLSLLSLYVNNWSRLQHWDY